MSVCWAESETPETRIKKVHRMRSGTRLILSPHGVGFAHAADAIENKIIPRPRNIGETWSTTMLIRVDGGCRLLPGAPLSYDNLGQNGLRTGTRRRLRLAFC